MTQAFDAADAASERLFHEIVSRDASASLALNSLILGDCISYGDYRVVFNCRVNPNWVVKFEHRPSRNNAVEYEVWQSLQGTKEARWFAPSLFISDCTRFLIQAKTERALNYPFRVPVCFNDMNRANYGILDGKFVCHDYGSFPLLMEGKFRLKTAEWS